MGRELDAGVVAVGQPADHVQAEELRVGQRAGRRRRVPDAGVGHVQAQLVEAEALVDDGDLVALRDAPSDHAHPGGRRRVEGGVLQQLGEQVGDVGGHGALHDDGLDVAEVHPVVVLDLGGGRAHHVDDGHGLAPAAGLLAAGQDQQALGVPTHAGCDVVEPEQHLEGVGVALAPLQLADDGHHPAQQVLVAPAEVLEGLGQVLPDPHLLDGEVDRGGHHRVEGLGGLAELVLGLDLDQVHLRPLDGEVHVPQLVGDGGQVALQATQRPGDRPDGEDTEDEGQGHEEGGDHLVTAQAAVEVGGGRHLAGGRRGPGSVEDPLGRGPLLCVGTADGEDGGLQRVLVTGLHGGDELVVDGVVELDRRVVGVLEQGDELGVLRDLALGPGGGRVQVVLLADLQVGEQAVDLGVGRLGQELLGVDEGPGLVLGQEGDVTLDFARTGDLLVQTTVDLQVVDGGQVADTQPAEREQRDGEGQNQPRADLESCHCQPPRVPGRQLPGVVTRTHRSGDPET